MNPHDEAHLFDDARANHGHQLNATQQHYQLAKLQERWERAHEQDAFVGMSDRYVPGEGSCTPDVMLIGEAPGAQEDQQLRPFVGTSGQVLRQLMDNVGLWVSDSKCTPTRPANAYLTNVVKFRPTRNRTPTWSEIRQARPLLRLEWVILGRPLIIITLGTTAYAAVTGKQRGLIMVVGKPRYPVSRSGLLMTHWPMWHPAYGLRTPAVRAEIENDWQELSKWMHTYKRQLRQRRK